MQKKGGVMKKFLSIFIVVAMAISLMAGIAFSTANVLNAGNPQPNLDIERVQQARDNYIKSKIKTPEKPNLPGKGIKAPTDGVEPLIPEDVKKTNLFKSGWIKVSIDCDGDALIKYALSKGKSTYTIDKAEAKSYISSLKNGHASLKSKASSMGIEMRNVHDMFVACNSFSAEVKTKNLKELIQAFGANKVHIAKLYKPSLNYSVPLIGSGPSGVWAYPGVEGTDMYVGVLDTGIDYTHPDFGGFTGIEFPTVKVPAGYDFGDSDTDPMDCQGHGTHVSGIVAADGTVKGVAPKAKIVFAKIVEGCEGSAWDTTIAEAFDYMADPNNLDGGPEGTHPPVASVNMSFGADNGFVDPTAPDQQAIENCIADGITVALSAGNEYDSYNWSGCYPWFPDYATIGSPAVTPNCIAVSASWNSYSRYPALSEVTTSSNYAYTVGSDSPGPVGALGDNSGAGYSYVYCELGGELSEFPTEVSGKIALIQRGVHSFSLKIANAEAAGAVGAIIFNDEARGDSLITMDTGGETLPSVFIGYSAGVALQGLGNTGRVAFYTDTYVDAPNAVDTMVDFSSWGPPPDLSFKPDITAPGGGIWSTVPVAQGSYANFSGTSMSSPYIAACAALVKEVHQDWTPAQVKTALMNTAKLLTDPVSGLPYLPHLMGAGRVNVSDALHTDVTLTSTSTGDPFVALGDIPNYKKKPVKFNLKLQNYGTSDVTYNISATAQNAAVPFNSSSLGDIVSTQPSGSITVPAGKTRIVKVTIDARNIEDWTGSPIAGWPYLEGFVSFTPTSGSDVQLHIPYMGFLGNWNNFEDEYAWDFNPVIDPAADDPMSFIAYAFGAAATWPQITDGLSWYLTGVDFDGNLDRDAIAFNPNDYYLEADMWLVRNAENLGIQIKNSKGHTIKTIDSVNQLYKMDWYFYNPYTGIPWWWDGTHNKGKNLVSDGQYHLVLTATAPKQFDKGSFDSPQVIDFPVKVDTQNPTVTITGTTDNGDGTVRVTWDAIDPTPSSGIWGYLVEYSTDGWVTYTDDWIAPTENCDDVPEDAEVFVVVFDNAGNVGYVFTIAGGS